MKECPFCAEEIPEAATMCAHCGGLLQSEMRSPSFESVPNVPVKKPGRSLLRMCLVGAVLFVAIVFGAFSESRILKGIGTISAGVIFFLIVPFSWWLNGLVRR